MSRLRVASIGAGRAGLVHARNIARHARADLVAVIDQNAEAAERFAAEVGAPPTYPSLEEAQAAGPLDAVFIATPTHTHRDLAVEAAEAGLHVFLEKPMAISLQECDDVEAAAARAGVVLQLGFMRRFQPEFAEAKARIEAGQIGEPMIVKSLTRGPGLPPAWAHDLSRSNGMLAEVNSHDFDCVRWLAGAPIERVYAEVTNRKGAARGVTADQFYDNAVVSLRFANEALGTIDGTCPADYGYDGRVEVLGTEGVLIIGDVRGTALIEVRDRTVGAITPIHHGWPQRFAPGYVAELDAFVAAILDGAPVPVTAEDGRHAVAAVLAANRSWQEERPVRLDEVTAGEVTA
ncbi:Gfo/Idh/MocA family oxidoreductase [Patulibacter sp. S7RM1-6]